MYIEGHLYLADEYGVGITRNDIPVYSLHDYTTIVPRTLALNPVHKCTITFAYAHIYIYICIYLFIYLCMYIWYIHVYIHLYMCTTRHPEARFEILRLL